jgi:hypothetical protein
MLKLFTSKYLGDLIVFSLLIVGLIYTIISSLFYGSPNFDLYLIGVITIFIGVIGFIFANSVFGENPFITTMQGVVVLIFVILLFGGAYVISKMYGWIFSLLYFVGFLIFGVYVISYFSNKWYQDFKDDTSCDNGIPYVGIPYEDGIPSDDSRYIPSEVKRIVWTRDHGRCVICGSNRRIHYDHDIPFSKGGSNTVDNIRILCEKCNLRKSDKIE